MKSRYQQPFFRQAYFSEFYNPKRTWHGIYLRLWSFQGTLNRRMPKKIKFRVVKIVVKQPVLSRNLTSLGKFLLKITITIHLSIAHVWSQFFEYIAQKISWNKFSNCTSSINFHTSSDNLFVDKTQRQLILRARLYRCQACRYKHLSKLVAWKRGPAKLIRFNRSREVFLKARGKLREIVWLNSWLISASLDWVGDVAIPQITMNIGEKVRRRLQSIWFDC